MATYNGEKYLKEQIDSVLNQTYADYELIICDDCSTDSTGKILEEFEFKDSRIKIYRNDKNLGYKKNFEKLAMLANGEFFAFCDQDDVWLENHLEVLISNIGNNTLISGDSYIFSNGKICGLLSERLNLKQFNNSTILYRLLCNSTIFSGHDSLYKKEIVKKSLPIPGNVKSHDGWFSVCAAILGDVQFVNIPITKYRIHENNISGNHNKYNLRNKIANFFTTEYKTDRIHYFEEIEKKFGTSISLRKAEIITNSKKIMFAKVYRKHCFSGLLRFIKNYKYIYTETSCKLLPGRVISFMLKRLKEE